MRKKVVAGQRNDLRRQRRMPIREKIEKMALELAERPLSGNPASCMGVTAHDLAVEANVSKEWARIILRGLQTQGRMFSSGYGQVKVYYVRK